MIRWLVRGIVREEIEAERENVARAIAAAITANNQQIERDLLRLGLIDYGDDGEVCPKGTRPLDSGGA